MEITLISVNHDPFIMNLKALIPQPLRDLFTQRPAGQSPIPVGQTPTYPAFSMNTYVMAYSRNSTVYTIVSLMARKFGVIPRYVYQVKDAAAQANYKSLMKMRGAVRQSKVEKIKDKAYRNAVNGDLVDDDLMALLQKPNPYMAQDTYYQAIYTAKKLTGNSYVWINRGFNPNVKGDARYDLKPLELWPLPSQYMTIVIDRTYMFGRIMYYVLYDQGQPIYYQPEDIIHWRDPNPNYDGYNFTHFYGVSPLEPGYQLLAQDTAGRDAAVSMMQNGGARGVLYNSDQKNLTPEQVASSQSAIDTKINNKNQKSAIARLPGTWGYLQLGENAVDMQLYDAQDKSFQRIANLLGCNPQLFETQTTFNNVEQARKDLITNAIMPDCASFRDEENKILLRGFGLDVKKYCIDVDISNIPELQDDMQKLTATIMSNWTLTPNERREELGFDLNPTPEADLMFIPNNLIPIEDAAVQTETLDPNGTPTNDLADDGTNDSTDGKPVSDNSKRARRRLSFNEVHEAWGKAVVSNEN